MRKRGVTAVICALVVAAVTAPSAGAATVAIDGHVIAPPAASGKRVTTTIVLTARSERAARLRKGVVRISLPRRTLIRAPKPTSLTGAGAGARGIIRVKPLTIRVGDRVRGSVTLTRKSRARLARRTLPTLNLRGSRIISRASMLSNDDLQRMIEGLSAQLRILSARVDSLAASASSGMRALSGRIDLTTARANQLDAGLSALTGLLGTLATKLAALEQAPGGGADEAVLQGLRDDLDGLLGRVGALENVSDVLGLDLGRLGSTVTGLLGSMVSADSRISDLLSVTSLLGDQLDQARGILSQVPGLITQMSGLDGVLTGLADRVTNAEGLIGGLGSTLGNVTRTVDGLVAQTGDIVADLGSQQLELTALQQTVGTLTDNLTTVTTQVGLLQGTVSGLNATVNGLTSDVTSLTGRVLRLQIVSDLVCAVPLLINCP